MPQLRLLSSGRRRQGVLAFIAVVSALAAGCRSSAPPPVTQSVSPDTWAIVDGRSITRADVEKAYNRLRDPSQPMSDEEVLTAKLNILSDLVLQDLLLAKAAELKVELPPKELDEAFAAARKNVPDDVFQQELSKRGLTAEDMREGLRREMLARRVLDQELAPKIAVSDQAVSDFFNANREQFHLAEEAYHIAQIVVTPARDPQIANATGDDATTPEAAAAKARMLMEKLKGGASFRELAAGYSEDPETAPNGGDLGFVPISRLKQAPAHLRNAVLNKKPGTVNLASAGGGYTLVLVVAHEPAGQRDLSTPGVKDRITNTLRARKEQLMRTAYLSALRDGADITNFFAQRLVESGPSAPSLLPASR